VTLNTFTGSATSAAVSLTTTSATPITFNISFSPTNYWLSVSANGSQVSANQSVTLNVFANATNITTQQTGSITIVPGNGGATTVIPVTLNVNGSPSSLAIVTGSPLPGGTVGATYSQALSATGGVTPYKAWTVVAGGLPPGTSLSALGGILTGLLNGIPTSPGVFTFTVEVTDNVNATATKQFSLTIGSTTVISANGIVNAASYAGGSVAPGEIVVIFGSGLGPGTLVGLQLDSRGYVSTSLAGTQVVFDGMAAPLVYTEAGQVSAVVPYEVSGRTSTQVQVVYQGQASNVVPMPVTSVMPGIFTDDASGHGQGAVLNEDGTVNSATNPAAAGSIVFFYATGEGQTIPGGVDGQPDGSPAPVPVAQAVTVTVGGINAPVLYGGGVPGLVAGVLQVNAQIPSGIVTGNAVPIVLTIGGITSQPGVTLAIR